MMEQSFILNLAQVDRHVNRVILECRDGSTVWRVILSVTFHFVIILYSLCFS